MNVHKSEEELRETAEKILNDPSCGDVFRVKGFLKKEDGQWLELNATRHEICIQPTKLGQEIMIVIGEKLNKEVIDEYWKTAPERYVSEKAFEELPDAFQKLAELLGEDQFELVAVNDEKDPQDQKAGSESAFSEAIAEKSDDNMYRVDSYVKNGEIRLVYLMNDAVESFLVFGNARMTGVYKPDYEGEILADLSRQGREYILVVHQDDSVVTLFFETLSLEKHLYDYSQIGHFWVKGYEYLRQLEYRLAILRDKYDYIGGDSCNALEEKLSALVEFPPLNYCCYPSVPEKYIVPRENPWIPSEISV